MADRKRNIIEYFRDAKEVIGFLFLIAGLGLAFGKSQTDIGNLKAEVAELRSDSKTVIELKTDLKNLTKSVDEIKGTNRDTYLLLLDMQKRN